MDESTEFESSATFKASFNTRQWVVESDRFCQKLQWLIEIIRRICSALDHRIKLIAHQG